MWWFAFWAYPSRKVGEWADLRVSTRQYYKYQLLQGTIAVSFIQKRANLLGMLGQGELLTVVLTFV